MSTFGEINWTDNNLDFGGKKEQKDIFLRLLPGDNELRFVTNPHQYLVHRIKKDPNNPKDFGQKVTCSALNGSCAACDTGDKAKPRWLVGVIDRRTNTYKVLDLSYMVFNQIKTHAANPKLGDPKRYDINIVVNPKGGATGYYTVQTYSKEPLSASDQALVDEHADMDDLKRRTQPSTPEQVQKRIEKILGDAAAAMPAPAPQSTPVARTATKATTVNMTDDDDLSEAFPEYETT